MSARRRWVLHSGSNSRQQTSTTQEYKNWSHCMTNVSIPEVNMLKNRSTPAVSVPINLAINFFSVNGPRETYSVDVLHTCIYLWFIWVNFRQLITFKYDLKEDSRVKVPCGTTIHNLHFQAMGNVQAKEPNRQLRVLTEENIKLHWSSWWMVS